MWEKSRNAQQVYTEYAQNVSKSFTKTCHIYTKKFIKSVQKCLMPNSMEMMLMEKKKKKTLKKVSSTPFCITLFRLYPVYTRPSTEKPCQISFFTLLHVTPDT